MTFAFVRASVALAVGGGLVVACTGGPLDEPAEDEAAADEASDDDGPSDETADDLDEEPLVATDLTDAPLIVQTCPEQFAQSSTCLTYRHAGDGVSILVVGVDDPTSQCTVQPDAWLANDTSFGGRYAAIVDDSLFNCGLEGLVHVDLRTGTRTVLGGFCRGVSAYGDAGLSVIFSPAEEGNSHEQHMLGVYPTVESALSGEAPQIVMFDGRQASVDHVVQNGVLYEMWFASSVVARWDTATGEELAPLELGVEQVHVSGLTVQGDTLLIASSRQGFARFDLTTGEMLDPFDIGSAGDAPVGITCDPYPEYQGIVLAE